MRVYLAGKMTGEPEHGFPVFNEMAAKLRAQGITVFNPAENAGDGAAAEADPEAATSRRAHFIRKDIFAIIGPGEVFSKVDAVVVLPNWYKSRGARLEVEIAMQCDIPVLYADTLETVDEGDLYHAQNYPIPTYLFPNYVGVPA